MRAYLSILLFVLTFSIGTWSLYRRPQLEFMGSAVEESFWLGWNLQLLGRFYADPHTPQILRAPGYPFFVACVIEMFNGKSPAPATDEAKVVRYHKVVREVDMVQCVLLSLSSSLLFLLIAQRLKPFDAFLWSLSFSCNPFCILLIGLLEYSVLHIFLTVGSIYLLRWALEKRGGGASFWAGLGWGLSTLVRPMTLLLPLFVFIAVFARFRFSLKPALQWTGCFALGMFLVVSPYTLRNYILTKRIIPVNAEGGINFWAATVKQPPNDPNYIRWENIWYRYGLELFSKVTHDSSYSYRAFTENILPLDDAFRRQAFLNIHRAPGIFLHNFIHTFLSFNFQISSVYIKVFEAIRKPGVAVRIEWFLVGNPQTFYSGFSANLFRFLTAVLTTMGLVGIFYSMKKHDAFLLAPLAAYLCLGVAHALTFLECRYYYIKMPFIFIFSAYFLLELDRCSFRTGFFIPASTFAAGVIAILTLSLTLSIL